MFISDAFAQDTTTTAEVGMPTGADAPYELSQEKMFKDTLVFLVLLFVIFYFVLIRPQQKKFKAHQEMSSKLKKGDKVITSGGIIGTIHKEVSEHVLELEVARDTYITIARGSISDLYREPEAKTPTPKAANDK